MRNRTPAPMYVRLSSGHVVRAQTASSIQCGAKYARKEHLKRHVASQHTEEEKKFACPDCNRSFQRSDVLARHRKMNCLGELSDAELALSSIDARKERRLIKLQEKAQLDHLAHIAKINGNQTKVPVKATACKPCSQSKSVTIITIRRVRSLTI